MIVKLDDYKMYLTSHMKGQIKDLIENTSQDFYEMLKIKGVIWVDLDEREYVAIPHKMKYI